MKSKILVVLSIIFCITIFFETLNAFVLNRILLYLHEVDYYIGYTFVLLFLIPILIAIVNIKSLRNGKLKPLGVILAIDGCLMSILISVSKADNLGNFIVKYHPYIYILPMFIISIGFKAFNKILALAGILITVFYTGLLIKYLGYPHNININFYSFYVRFVFEYVVVLILQIVYTIKFNDKKDIYAQ